METIIWEEQPKPHQTNVRNPLLSERDGNVDFLAYFTFIPIVVVRNPLLSERDGNTSLIKSALLIVHTCQKPTTLWKRWKPQPIENTMDKLYNIVRNPLLSERDGNLLNASTAQPFMEGSQKPTTLWKRWKLAPPSLLTRLGGVRQKPTTLWKRWKPAKALPTKNFYLFLSETHYSLKEMETTNLASLKYLLNPPCQKPTTLWKRWKPFQRII